MTVREMLRRRVLSARSDPDGGKVMLSIEEAETVLTHIDHLTKELSLGIPDAPAVLVPAHGNERE